MKINYVDYMKKENEIFDSIYKVKDEKVIIASDEKFDFTMVSPNYIKIKQREVNRNNRENIIVMESYDYTLEEYLKSYELSIIEIKRLLLVFTNIFEELHKKNYFQRINLTSIFIKMEKKNQLSFKIMYPKRNNNNDHTISSDENENILFFSPQYLKDDSSIDGKDDIWTLGIILYYITHKKFPYDKKKTEILQSEEIESNNIEFKTDLDKDLKNLMEKMLKIEKKERLDFKDLYNSIKDILNKDDFWRLFEHNIINSKLTFINLFRLFYDYLKYKNENCLLNILINVGFFLFRISFHIFSSILFHNDESISFVYHKDKNLDKLTIPNSINCWIIFTIINLFLKLSQNNKFRIFVYSTFIIIQIFSLIFSISFFNVFENTHQTICIKVVFNYFLCNCYIFILFFINAYLKREYITLNRDIKMKNEKIIKILDYLI